MELREKVLALFAEPEFCPENYRGETDENGLPHGMGKMKYASNNGCYWLGYADYDVAPKRYEGEWCHGVRSGNGKMVFEASGCSHYSYDGEWVNGLPEGKGVIRVIPNVGKERVLPCNFVAGLREGYNTAVEFGKTIECQWVAGCKEGDGVCTMPNGKKFKGVWHNDNLNLDSCDFVEPKQNPKVIVTLQHHGCQYKRRIVALIEATVGLHTIADALVVLEDKGFKQTEPLVEVLSIENGVVKYRVDGSYSESNTVQVGTIAPAEKVQLGYSKSAKYTIYDEDYEYDIIHKVTIKYVEQ
ncbi:MAG: hypothetical protein J6K33_10040 [Alistipes sp.]|nr:hypothetical protein [Alistipes sp.]